MANNHSTENSIVLSVVDNEPRIDSRLVAAELGVAHQSARELVDKYSLQFEELGILRFETGEIKGRGQPEKFYLLSEDQAYFLMTLVRNTTQAVELKKRLVLAFAEYRKNLHVPRELSRMEILTMALESERERERLAKENEQLAKDNEEMKPKAEYHDRLLGYQETFDADHVAKLLKTSKPKLFMVLRQNKVFMKSKNIPMQRFIDRGFMVIKPTEYKDQFGVDRVSLTTEFTQIGVKYVQTLVDRFFE